MVDINATLPLLGPISYTIKGILDVVQLLVGGIFGLYVIAFVVRLVFFKKIYNAFEEIKKDMKRIESKIDKLGKKK